MTTLALNVQDAATACGVSADVIRRAIRSNDLPVKYVTSRPLILVSDLTAWLEAAPTERPGRAS